MRSPWCGVLSFVEDVQDGGGKEIMLEEKGPHVLMWSQLKKIGDRFSAAGY